MIRLELTPIGAGRFAAYLDGELICKSDQPIYDGARALLVRGYDPGVLLTTRHRGSPHDSFQPAPVGRLAQWTVSETDRGMRLQKYRPYSYNVGAD